jgi:hypothetical protein
MELAGMKRCYHCKSLSGNYECKTGPFTNFKYCRHISSDTIMHIPYTTIQLHWYLQLLTTYMTCYWFSPYMNPPSDGQSSSEQLHVCYETSICGVPIHNHSCLCYFITNTSVSSSKVASAKFLLYLVRNIIRKSLFSLLISILKPYTSVTPPVFLFASHNVMLPCIHFFTHENYFLGEPKSRPTSEAPVKYDCR